MSSRSSLKFVAERVGLVRMATLALLAGFGVVFAGGCKPMGEGALGGECLLDSDCQPNLICAYQFCHIPCNETRDCDAAAGEECLVGHESDKSPYNYCAIPPECTRNSECGDYRACADDQKCRDVCFQDEDCLGDQRCFHGSCRNVTNPPAAGWDAPAGLGELCHIPSDCASRNCSNYVCVGCVEDFDCGGTRTCDPTALDDTGACRGGTGPLSAKVTPISTNGLRVSSAALNSNGSMLYFLEPMGGLYKIPTSNGLPVGYPEPICMNIPYPLSSETDIVVSPDDTTIYFSMGFTLRHVGVQANECADIVTVPEIKDAMRVDVEEQDGIDIVYVLNNLGVLYITSGETGDIWQGGGAHAVDFTIGTQRNLLLNFKGQVAQISDNGQALIAIPDAVGDLNLGSIPVNAGIALSITEETVYVTATNNGLDYVFATDLTDIGMQRKYTIDIDFFDQYNYQLSLGRARNKNLFTWVTSDCKLYLFEPL